MMLSSSRCARIVGAHDGLSAAIASQFGFDAVWASGFGLSTAKGVRDANELSWSEVSGCVSDICEGTSLPVLVDGDTGFGSFNNARIFARKVETVGAAGLCIEDDRFPKQNSFLGPEADLEELSVFIGKLKALLDSRRNSSFLIVARAQGFVHGQAIEQVLERAHAYADANVDALLIHSIAQTPHEIFSFMAQWNRSTPVIIVPTSYHSALSSFHEHGIAAAIYANQMLRAAAYAMHAAASELMADRPNETGLVTMKWLFDLLGYDALALDKKHYEQH